MRPFRVLAVKFRDLRMQVRHVPSVLMLVLSAAKKWTIAWAILLALQGLVPVATIYLTRSLIDILVAAARHRSASRTEAVELVTALSVIYLFSELLQSMVAWIRSGQADLIQDHLNGLIHQKSAEVDLQFYETPACHDHLHRARIEANHRPVALLESLGGISQNLITLIAMLAVLAPFGAWVPLALIASTLPAFAVVLAYGVRQYDWRRRTTAVDRRTWYYDWLLTTGSVAAELRLFDLGSYFRRHYQTLRATLREERKRLATMQLLGECSAAVAGIVISAGCILWVISRTSEGHLTVGNAVLFCLAFQNGLRLMHSLLGGVEQLYTNSLFLRDLFELLALQPTIVDTSHPVPAPVGAPEIRFREISFRYPGSHAYALRDFDLLIPARKMVALVGANGSGKSTLVKLLCRLYDPASGAIELDGVDIRQMPVNEVRRLITVLFQEPVRYNDTVSDNIAIGSLRQGPSAAAIRAAGEAAGAGGIIENLPEGYLTLLGKAFSNGNDLSVGEWQRIALARAVLRKSGILILDEPTSAMDSWAEAEWLMHFRTLAQGQTSVVITHRFTTAMYADIIHVVAEGKIIESGSHSELLSRGGRYAQSWSAQMQIAIHV